MPLFPEYCATSIKYNVIVVVVTFNIGTLLQYPLTFTVLIKLLETRAASLSATTY